MKPMAFNLKNAKKVAGDAHSSTFEMNGGHQIKVAHHAVSTLHRKQLEKMPVHKYADGGDVLSINADQPNIPDSQINPEPGAMSQSGAVHPFTPEQDPGDLPYGVTPEMMKSMRAPADQSDQAQSSQAMPVPGDGMPQSQQAPMAPSGDIAGGYAQGLRGIQEQQDVAAKQAKAQEAVQAKDIADRQKLAQDAQTNFKTFQDQQQHFLSDYANDHISPNHYVENMTTGQKVATGIGLLLGGFSSAFTKDGQNPAMNMLNKQIDRDIESQRSRIDQKRTVLGANQQMFHDQVLAENQTRVNMNDIYDHKIQLEAAKLGTPQAKAAADQASAKFKMENAGLLQQNALRSAALNGAANGALDPARLVPILVPKEHQAKAFAEIQAAEDTRKMGGDILKAFEDAAKENTVLRTGAGMLRTPGSVGALHQAMQPTFKDLEGTVRQAAMDNTFKNITPMPGDTEHKIAQKRESLQEYLKSKLSAPTARGYGIDLGKFQSTAPMQSSGQGSAMEGKTASDGKGNRIIMKGGRWVPYGA